MLYAEERREILRIVDDLLAFHLLDPAGGELSRRCGDDHVLITPTGSAFRRFRLAAEDLVVLDTEGRLVAAAADGRLAPGGTPLHLAIFRMFPLCRAILHTHSRYSLAFAVRGLPVPSVTNLMDTLGEVPCLYADDARIKREMATKPVAVEVPDGMVQRPEVAAIHLHHHVPRLAATLGPRRDELARHGLAFTLYRHGTYVFARGFDEAFENLVRIESNAHVALLSAGLPDGTARETGAATLERSAVGATV